MVKTKANKKSEQPTSPAPGDSNRRRGRPTGKNRVPLTIEERRARNALYEQERRNDFANAFTDLAGAISVDPNMTHAELLEKTLTYIKERTERSRSVIKRQNAKLKWQIKKLTKDVAPFQHEAEVEGDQGATSNNSTSYNKTGD